MPTISCYTFHPLIQRFVRLYRYVQVVSAWLTCLLSVLCCSCADAMPISRASSATTASYEKTSSLELDTGRSKEHVTIDIAPAAGDSDVMEKGNKVLNKATASNFTTKDVKESSKADSDFTKKGDTDPSKPAELEAVVVAPVKKTERIKKDLSTVPVHRNPEAALAAKNQKLPTLAALIQNQAAQKKVLQADGRV